MHLYCREEKRTANIVADDSDGQGVTCLVIDRESFHHLKDLDDIKNRYIDLPERKKRVKTSFMRFRNFFKLNDFI